MKKLTQGIERRIGGRDTPGGQAPDWRITRTYNQQYTAVDDGHGDTTNILTAYDVDYYLIDIATGNPVEGGGPERADILKGTAANDHLMGLGGNDTLRADGSRDGGDDLLEGGAGRDWIQAGSGNDILLGGSGGDLLAGGAGNDRLYGDSETTTGQAIANGSADIPNGMQGDWLAGNGGDDTLISREGNDVLSGGGGNDLLIAGAGAGEDDILGDADYSAQGFDWTVTLQADGTTLFQPSIGVTNPPDSGNDTIYAGGGADHVWAGSGADIVYGEGDNDTLNGEAGNDILFGGAGNNVVIGGAGDDVLYGGEDNDYLDGGDGDDTLWGGNGNDNIYGDGVTTTDQAILDGNNNSGTGQKGDWLAGGILGNAANDAEGRIAA